MTDQCPHCGKELGKDEGKGRTRLPVWFRVLLGFVVVAIVAILLVAFNMEDLTDTVEGQLVALKEDRVTEAYYHFTSRDFQEAASLETFRDFIKQYPALSHATSVRFIDRNVDGDKGALDAMVSVEGGAEDLIHYSLVKEDNRWKILSIKVKEEK